MAARRGAFACDLDLEDLDFGEDLDLEEDLDDDLEEACQSIWLIRQVSS